MCWGVVLITGIILLIYFLKKSSKPSRDIKTRKIFASIGGWGMGGSSDGAPLISKGAIGYYNNVIGPVISPQDIVPNKNIQTEKGNAGYILDWINKNIKIPSKNKSQVQIGILCTNKGGQCDGIDIRECFDNHAVDNLVKEIENNYSWVDGIMSWAINIDLKTMKGLPAHCTTLSYKVGGLQKICPKDGLVDTNGNSVKVLNKDWGESVKKSGRNLVGFYEYDNDGEYIPQDFNTDYPHFNIIIHAFWVNYAYIWGTGDSVLPYVNGNDSPNKPGSKGSWLPTGTSPTPSSTDKITYGGTDSCIFNKDLWNKYAKCYSDNKDEFKPNGTSSDHSCDFGGDDYAKLFTSMHPGDIRYTNVN